MSTKKYSLYWCFCLIIALLCFLPYLSFAQKKSSDQLFLQALKASNLNKNYPQAISLAKEGLKLSPDDIDIRLLLGRLYLLSHRETEAEIEWRSILVKNPYQVDALYYLVNLSYENKNLQQAILYASQYLKRYPTDKQMLSKRIAISYEVKDFTSGESYLQEAKTLYPTDQQIKLLYIDSHLNAAMYYQKQGNFRVALKEYEQVLEEDPLNSIVLQALFNLNNQLDDKEFALKYADLISQTMIDPSILFKKADILKSMNRFDEALVTAGMIQKSKENEKKLEFLYQDVLLTKAKYQLQHADTLSALNTYDQLLIKYPNDTISRQKLINFYGTQGKWQEALTYIDSGLKRYPNNQALWLQKLNFNREMGDISQAYQLSKLLRIEYPENDKIKEVNNELFTLSRQNKIGLSTGITFFDLAYKKPWNLYSAYYMHSGKYGAIGTRVNYADRKEANGYQFEIEAYPVHAKGYSYFNMAYANTVVFPRFRLAYSYFLPVNKTMEAEFGFRYSKSDLSYLSYTVALGKYFNKYWVNLKSFITPNRTKLVSSFTLTGRYYLNSLKDDYFTGFVGYGFSPDDRNSNFEITERLNLQSIRFGLGYQRTVWRSNVIGLHSSWNNQEYLPGKKRNEFDVVISFQHRF